MGKAGIFVILSLCLLAFPITGTGSSPGSARGYVFAPPGSTDYPWTMFRSNGPRTGATLASGPSSGNLMWTSTATSPIYSSPAVADATVFVSSYDGNVYAIDEYSGLTKWSVPTGQFITSSPAVSNGVVYITTACPTASGQPFSCKSGSVYALDEQTGSLVWQRVDGSPITSSPLVDGGKVFYGTITLGNGQVFARDAATGIGGPIAYLSDAVSLSSLAVDSGRLFVGQVDGAVVSLNETSGAQIWRVIPTAGTVSVLTTPAVGNGMVFVGTTTRGVAALNEFTGTNIWTFATGGFNTTSVALSGGRVYFGTGGGNVYALNATTGVRIWTRTTGAGVSSSPALALGSSALFVGSNDHYLYALNAATGGLSWKYLTGSGVFSSPAIADYRVFFGSEDGKVYGLGVIATKLTVTIRSNSTSLRPGSVAGLVIRVTNGTAPQPANLTLTSSAGGGFTQPVTTSPGVYGSDFTAPLVSSTVNSTIQVAASSSNYVSGFAQTGILLVPFPTLTVAVSPVPSKISPGGEITLEIQVSNASQMVPGAAIALSSSSGGSFSGMRDNGNGNYTAVFSSPLQGSGAVITVQASKPGFSSGQGQATVSINGIPDLTSLKLAGVPFIILLIGGVLLFFLIVAGLMSRRKGEPARHYLPKNKPQPTVPNY